MHAAGLVRMALCSVSLLVVCSCKSSDDGGTGGRGGRGGRGGTSASAGHGGTVSDAGPDAARDAATTDAEGGAGGRSGSDAAANGGTGGSDVDDADSGAPEAGSGGQSGSGGGSAQGGAGGAAGSGDPAYEECLSDAQAAGQDVGDCARCMCQANKCRTQLTAATQDAKSNAVVICSQASSCTDVCCLCGESPCGLSNYGTGPCASEVKVAADVGAQSGLESALTVSEKCARAATDDNSCHKVTVLADCQLEKCADVCPAATSCPAPP